MRSSYPAGHIEVEHWVNLHEFDTVGGIKLGVYEPRDKPDTINLVMIDTVEGISVLAELDRSSPGARARAISLGETVFDAMEMAAITWNIGEDGKQKPRGSHV